MVADDQRGLLADGLGGRLGGDGQAGHDPLDLAGGIAPEQPDIVPVLGQVRRGELLEPGSQVGNGCHACRSSRIRARAGSRPRVAASRVRGPARSDPSSRAIGSIPRTELVRNTSSAEWIGIRRHRPFDDLESRRSGPARSRRGPHDAGQERAVGARRDQPRAVPDQEEVGPGPLADQPVRRDTQDLVGSLLAARSCADPPAPVIERLVPGQEHRRDPRGSDRVNPDTRSASGGGSGPAVIQTVEPGPPARRRNAPGEGDPEPDIARRRQPLARSRATTARRRASGRASSGSPSSRPSVQPLQVPRQQRRHAVPGPKRLEEAQPVLEGPVEHADPQRFVGQSTSPRDQIMARPASPALPGRRGGLALVQASPRTRPRGPSRPRSRRRPDSWRDRLRRAWYGSRY